MLRTATSPTDWKDVLPNPATDERVPVIARIAGLPISAATELRGEGTVAALGKLTVTEEAASALRRAVADDLYRAVPEVDPVFRRRILLLKRNCFNNRPLGALDDEHLEALRPWTDDRLERIIALEEELAEHWNELRECYADDRERSRRHLLQQCENTEFRRGLILASRHTERVIARLRGASYSTYGRRERGAEQSLTRYVTRASVKLSPFSTFTKIALGFAEPGSEHSPLEWVQEMDTERSLVRLQTYIPAQWVALLCSLPVVREALAVRLNPTLELLPSGHLIFQRPMMLEHEPKQGHLTFRKPSVAKLKIGGSLFDLLGPRLAAGPESFASLSTELARELQVDHPSVSAALHRFLDLQLLEVVPPWPSYCPRLEEAMLQLLNSGRLRGVLEASPALSEVRESLGRLVEAEIGFAEAPSPRASLDVIWSAARAIFETLRNEVAPAEELSFEMAEQDIYEDVLLQGGTDSGLGEVLRFDSFTARGLLCQARNLWRIRGVFERRHECLHALWHRIGGSTRIGERIPCLRFFRENREIWERYMGSVVHERNTLFDPYDLHSIRSLEKLRREVLAKLGGSLRPTEHGFEIPPEVLTSVAAEIPERYLSPLDACATVQPADAEHQNWVAHHITGGNGRLSCRYNSLLPLAARDWFIARFKQYSEWGKERRQEGLDLFYTRPTPIGAHWPQTRAVLELPGEFNGPEVERLLRPGELFVEVGEEAGELHVVDGAGNSYLPSLLSVIEYAWVPTFIKFLALFGTDSRARFDIPLPTEKRDGLEASPRLSTGSLIFRRRRWEGPAHLFVSQGKEEDADSFVRLWRRRQELGLPRQVFWIEKLESRVGSRDIYKPQFIDFDSPTLVALFAHALSNVAPNEPVTLEEALPEPEVFNGRPGNGGRALEVILEGVAFTDQSSFRSRSRSRDRQAPLRQRADNRGYSPRQGEAK